MHIKATTTKCVAISELTDIRVVYKGYDKIRGKIMGHTAVINTPFIYTFWDNIDIKLPMPCALPDINNLSDEIELQVFLTMEWVNFEFEELRKRIYKKIEKL